MFVVYRDCIVAVPVMPDEMLEITGTTWAEGNRPGHGVMSFTAPPFTSVAQQDIFCNINIQPPKKQSAGSFHVETFSRLPKSGSHDTISLVNRYIAAEDMKGHC